MILCSLRLGFISSTRALRDSAIAGSSGACTIFGGSIDGFGRSVGSLLALKETVYVRIPPLLPERSVIEVPIHGLGVHNLFLHLHTRISRRV